MSCFESALDLACLGLPVFPLHSVVKMDKCDRYICTCGKLDCGSAGKHPLGRVAPNGFKGATTDKAKVSHWFTCYPDANVGLATGSIVVVDVDPRNGGDISLRQLERCHGELPHTWRSITGGGGEHIFFAPPAGSQISCIQLSEGIDLKAGGGYIVAPPSKHVSGRNYCWNVDYHPDTTPLAPLPAWIAELSKRRAGVSWSVQAWRGLIGNGVSEGERNTAIAAVSGHLLRHYVDPKVVLELLLAWNAGSCKPPLPHSEIVTIVDSIARRELARRKAQ